MTRPNRMALENYEAIPYPGPPTPAAQRQVISGGTKFLFLVFVAYTACPIIEVPGLDLSFSALIIIFITLNVFLGSRLSGLPGDSRWKILSLLIWGGIFFSLIANALMGSAAKIDLDNFMMMIRFTYWIFVFLITYYVASRANLWPQLVRVLILMLLLTALLRWGEATILGGAGFGAKTKLLTLNMYGIIFSTFTPFLLVPLFSRGGRRWPAALAAIIVWGAVAINGSRGAWISVGAGIIAFMALYVRTHPGRIMALFGVMVLLALCAGVLVLAPGKYSQAISDRASSFQDLDRDKSVSTRKLMVQKGWRLFLDNPIAGIGIGGFKKIAVKLETDRTDVSQGTLNRRSAHNSYIAYLAETGLAGVIPLALLLLTLTLKGYKAAVILARREEIWALAVLIGFLMMSMHLWVLAGLTGTGTWVVYGLVAAMITTAGQTAGAPSDNGNSRPGEALGK